MRQIPGQQAAAVPAVDAADVSIVVVSYNTAALLRQCLASVRADVGPSREVFVVDNASTDGSAALVAAEFPEVHLIANDANVGFTRANNQALRIARGRHLLLLNPDAELRLGALATLVGCLDADPTLGVVGPRLHYPDGELQSSRRRFPTLATGFVESTILQRWFPRLPMLRRYYCDDLPVDRQCDVDWVVGACLLARREAADRVGFLDERFFMYSEELDWCRRIKDAGWRIAYVPSAVVIHHESRSAEQNLARRDVLFNESKVRYYAKYHGAFWGGALRAHILLTFVALFLEEGAKLLLGHKRALRRQRLGRLGGVLRAQARGMRGGSV